MRKNLIFLVIVFILAVAGTALAAPATNPFGDVPRQHWAYDAVNKLIQARIIDGYGDGKFYGDKPITRYEMATMVARAIWNADKADNENKLLIDKLSQEYAGELENLGVRVAKLEKKVGSIAVSGDARLRWIDDGSGDTKFAERVRIYFKSDLNDNTSFYGRIVGLNNAEMGTYKTSTDTDRFSVADAAFTTKDFCGTTLTVGRFSQTMDPGGYWMNTSGGVDGFKVMAGKVLKVTAGFANFGPYAAMAKGTVLPDPTTTVNGEIKDAFFVQAVYPTSKATSVGAWYFKEKTGSDSKFDITGLTVTSRLLPNVTMLADYGRNDIETNGQKPEFCHARLTYGDANPAKPGSWSMAAEYRKFEAGVNNSAYTSAMVGSVSDAKGWALIGSKAIAKNITFTTFYGFNTKRVSTNADIDNYTRFQLDYLF